MRWFGFFIQLNRRESDENCNEFAGCDIFLGGQVLAEDDPCANENGAAYGLCNAYCEAMDCDSFDAVSSRAIRFFML